MTFRAADGKPPLRGDEGFDVSIFSAASDSGGGFDDGTGIDSSGVVAFRLDSKNSETFRDTEFARLAFPVLRPPS